MIRFLRPTVDSIISNITKQVEQLRDAADRHHTAVLEHDAETRRHEILSIQQANERDRARAIAAKLKELIS